MDLASLEFFKKQQKVEDGVASWLKAIADKYVRAGDNIIVVDKIANKFPQYLASKNTQVLTISPTLIESSNDEQDSIVHRQGVFPLASDNDLWQADKKYDFLFCVDFLMHISEHRIFEMLHQFQKILKVGGYLALSTLRGIANLDKKSRDEHGVLYCQREIDQYQLVLERLGFDIVDQTSEQVAQDDENAGFREVVIAILETRIDP
ncbi:MAG: class I SAM-dependent methyltransferase [Fibrobacter sp.]|nr:class I SAM-dependent methyltransferase [Fibrobacter sp.]